MKRNKQPEIKTVEDLADWLLDTRPRAACVIAQSAINPSEVHFASFGGDKLAAEAFVAGSELLMNLIHHLDPVRFTMDDDPRAARAARRRMERRR